MRIYERAAAAVPLEEKYEVWQLYIKRATTIFGVTFTRQLYEQALEGLPDAQARDIALQYADLERKVGTCLIAVGTYFPCLTSFPCPPLPPFCGGFSWVRSTGRGQSTRTPLNFATRA